MPEKKTPLNDPKLREKLLKYVRSGVPVSVAVAAIGLKPGTYYKWRHVVAHPEKYSRRQYLSCLRLLSELAEEDANLYAGMISRLAHRCLNDYPQGIPMYFKLRGWDQGYTPVWEPNAETDEPTTPDIDEVIRRILDETPAP